tara:strand:- start:189 stop:527 length:339 start_codon:yes stop_codon:yes gene_type:complete
MMGSKTYNTWGTDNCGRCGEKHEGYTGKLDKDGVEYVVCGITHKRINITDEWELKDTTWNTKVNGRTPIHPLAHKKLFSYDDIVEAMKGEWNGKLIFQRVLNKLQTLVEDGL